MILVYLEHDERTGTLPRGARAVATAAFDIRNASGGGELVAVVAGKEGVAAAASSAAQLGFSRVVAITDDLLAHYHPTYFTEALVSLRETLGASIVVGAASARGKDLFPRVAFRLQSAQASDITAVEGRDGSLIFERPVFAGNFLAKVELATAVKVVTVRAASFLPALEVGSSAPIEAFAVSLQSDDTYEVVSFSSATSERPALTDAEVVVSGGRALKSKEAFSQLLEPLADVLGGALGASRAAVDAGYAPNDWQVGQTGKVVSPKLYIAVGISGAIQHLAGMKGSKVVVAINSDAEAPIFEVADYGLVGDLFQIVPELTAALKQLS